MADNQDSSAKSSDIFHFAETFFLKLGIPHRQHFIDDENLRIEVRGDGEGKPDIHAAGVALDRRVNEFFDSGKSDDFIEFSANLGPSHAQDGAIKENILSSGQLGVKARANLEQAGDASLDLDTT